ncbi:hypothetical protein THAOC_05217, partial [Thalassiosira oceanica]
MGDNRDEMDNVDKSEEEGAGNIGQERNQKEGQVRGGEPALPKALVEQSPTDQAVKPLNPATAVAENGSSQNRAMEHPRRPPSEGCSTARFATIQFLATSAAAKSQAFFARLRSLYLASARACLRGSHKEKVHRQDKEQPQTEAHPLCAGGQASSPAGGCPTESDEFKQCCNAYDKPLLRLAATRQACNGLDLLTLGR